MRRTKQSNGVPIVLIYKINFYSASYAYVSHTKTFSAIGVDFTFKLKAWAGIMNEFFKPLTQRNRIELKGHPAVPSCFEFTYGNEREIKVVHHVLWK